MRDNPFNKSFWFARISGYSISRFELSFFMLLVFFTVVIFQSNVRQSSLDSYNSSAFAAYDSLKNTLYLEMSSPSPKKKYLIKNILGPISLPKPLESTLLAKGVRLNYLIRINQPARSGRGRDQLRFEVSHDKGSLIYRYTEIEGEILEQVIQKTVIDD